MKKNLSATILVALIFLILPIKNYAQNLNLGFIEKCTIFSVNGAVTSSGTANKLNGNISAHIGGVVGFNKTSLDYNVHEGDAYTSQAKIDILNAFILLNNVPVTNTVHLPSFSAETINPGVYLITKAGSVSGTVILDGGNNPDAVFIFKFQGAFNLATSCNIILSNGTRAANVFWLAEGAISAGTDCTIAGTLIAHPGAVTLGSNSTILGRMLSTTGAINFGPGSALLPDGPSTIPISCVDICDNNILGTVAQYALFTGFGALTNTGVSGVIGKIGADGGSSIDGFGSSIVIGSQELNNDATNKAKADLISAYEYLKSLPNSSITDHAGQYGLADPGETLSPGVYNTAAEGSVLGTLVLDGGGNENAQFVFKIGGAFTAAAFSRVILINGARRCNVFWVVTGAVTLGTLSFMKGNVINNGATGTTGQVFLEGRLLTTAGACAFNTSTTYISNSLCAGSMNNNFRVLPIKLSSFTGDCYKQNIALKWTTSTEVNNKNFNVERSIDGKNWELAGSIAGAGNSNLTVNYSLTDYFKSTNKTIFYRLKQTDADDNFSYSKIITVTKCGANDEDNLSFSPNPSSGAFDLNFSGDKSIVSSTEIFNEQGTKVYRSNGFQSKINLANQATGIYLVRIMLNSKLVIRKIVIAK